MLRSAAADRRRRDARRETDRFFLSNFRRASLVCSFGFLMLVVCAVLVLGYALTSTHSGRANRSAVDRLGLIHRRDRYALPLVERDRFGIPHIRGDTHVDASFGLGFAHAEDDFASIQKSLLGARAMLGLVSRKFASRDSFMKQFRFEERVAAHLNDQTSPMVMKTMQAYADGLNVYAALHPEELVHPSVVPFEPEHIALAFIHKQGLLLGLDRVMDMVAKGGASIDGGGVASSYSRHFGGGTCFAIAGVDRLNDTVLVGNPHMPWAVGPLSLWEAHVSIGPALHADDHRHNGVYGAYWPGVPYPVMMAHNGRFGWCLSLNQPHVVRLHPLDPMGDIEEEAHTRGSAHRGKRYRVRREFAKRDGGGGGFDRVVVDDFDEQQHSSPMVVTVEESTFDVPYSFIGHWGWNRAVPRLWASEIECPVVHSGSSMVAVCVAGSERLAHMEQLHRMSHAKDFRQWKAAIDMQHIAMFNAVYADARHIFYQYSALIPRLDARARHWMARRSEKDVYHSLEDLPHILNPSNNVAWTAGNSPFVGGGEDHHHSAGDEVSLPASSCIACNPVDYPSEVVQSIGEHRSPHTPNRALRLARLLAEARAQNRDGLVSYDAVKRIKFDTTYDPSSEVAQMVQGLLQFYRETTLSNRHRGKPLITQDFNETIHVLAHWDLNASIESRGAALALPVLTPYVRRASNDDRGRPDGANESDESVRTRMYSNVHLSLLRHIRSVRKAYGSLNITWGELQKIGRDRFREPLHGGPDLMRHVLSRKYQAHYVGVAGDTLMFFMRFSKNGTVTTQAVHPFGNSAKAASPHFMDQSKLFSSNALRNAWYHPRLVQSNIVSRYVAANRSKLPPKEKSGRNHVEM